MTKRYKVLIVEDDSSYYEPLKECMNKTDDFEVIQVTDSAPKALTFIKSSLPDAIVIDLQLREGDGMLLLEQLHKLKQDKKLAINPYILATTFCESDRIAEKLNSGFADYFLSKKVLGYGPDLIIDHLYAMSSTFDCNRNNFVSPDMSPMDKKDFIQKRVERELEKYYIRQGNNAKNYLKDAICMVIEKPLMPKPIIRNILKTVARKYEKEWRNIDVSISRLLEQAFVKTDPSVLEQLYKPYIDIDTCKPYNSEFIYYVADKIRKEMAER